MASLVQRLEEAKELEVGGKWAEAEDLLTSLIGTCSDAPSNSSAVTCLLAITYNQRGIARRMLEKYDDAFADYEEAFKVSPDNEQKAFACVNMADIHRVASSDFGAAHVALDDALTYAENGSSMHAKATDQRGLVFMGQADHNSAIASYKKARDICEKLLDSQPDDKDVKNRFGQVVHHLGVAYVASEDPDLEDEAYASQMSALDIFMDLGDQQGMVNAMTTLGRISLIKGGAEGALEQYQKAWGILEETGYNRAISTLALDIAEAKLMLNPLDDVTPYLERFGDGVLSGEVTDHDMGVLKDQLTRVVNRYLDSGLAVGVFEDALDMHKHYFGG